MSRTVLFVDDEENILSSLKRLFQKSDIQVLTATSGSEALEILRRMDVAVMVSDQLMPGMKGDELLVKARSVSPDTVRIMMTGHGDLPTALQAINSGEVFRFLLKPWENQILRNIIEEALARHLLFRSMRNAEESTLLALAQTIELKDSYTRGHCERVADYALRLAAALDFSEDRSRKIKFGSWLHDCGKIGVPESILNYKGPLTANETETMRNHPRWGAEVATQAHLPAEVVNIILYHHERFDGSGYPHGITGAEIPLEARIVAIADVFDALRTDRPYEEGKSLEEAIEILRQLCGRSLDPELTDRFIQLVADAPVETGPA
ncbi:response regulator [Desulfuromonas carbonis]|uniref:HD domain-containing phosphohydrolase n=1 Tax=Desulfuromonas sp. DDH964 TaxID=1823759 RepID=UPI00078CD268|nr:HD domain-containing phosphohydrolase [Desulfuromonas sp. DDH964]AMV72254.1 response receiver-modulated cyclic diguanylate phosphodiesterase [Desulfuromonas sp. DDH964]